MIGGGEAYNLRSALEEVRLDLEPSASVDSIVTALPGRLTSLVPALGEMPTAAAIQLKLVGLRDDKSVGVVHLDGLTPDEDGTHSSRDPGVSRYGFTDVASRIVLGRPNALPVGMEPGPAIQYHIPTRLMSLGDAVSLAETLVAVSATVAQYVIALEVPSDPDYPATPIAMPIGGHIHSATLTRDAFRWVREPVLLEHQRSTGSGDSNSL